MEVVPKTNVARAGGIGGSGRNLEPAAIAGPATQPQHQFLDLEVTGIGRFLDRVTAKVHGQTDVEGDGESLPGVDGVAAAKPTLHRRHRRARDTDPVPELGLCQTSTPASIAQPTPEPCELLPIAPGGLGGKFLSSILGHGPALRSCAGGGRGVGAGRGGGATSCCRPPTAA